MTVSDYHKRCHKITFNVKLLFDDYGFIYAFVYINTVIIEINTCVKEFKRGVYDNFTQDWYRTLNNSLMLDVCQSFTTNFEYESTYTFYQEV